MSKLTEKDLTIEVDRDYIRISCVINAQLEWMDYLYYSKSEAITLFLNKFNKSKTS